MKNRSKHRHKRVWKQTDVKDVEDYLDDQRLTERLGGPYSERSSESLFHIDRLSSSVKRKLKSKKNAVQQEKPLRCFSALNSLTLTKARAPSKRLKGPAELEIESTTKLKSNPEKVARYLHQEAQRITNRRLHRKGSRNAKAERKVLRTQFGFDIWDDGVKLKRDGEVDLLSETKADVSWFDDATRRHTRAVDKFASVPIPRGYIKKPSLLPAVEVPHPGLSYNPSYVDHQSLLLEASKEERIKDAMEQKIKKELDDRFPTESEMPTEASRLQEMAEGLEEKLQKVLSKKMKSGLKNKSDHNSTGSGGGDPKLSTEEGEGVEESSEGEETIRNPPVTDANRKLRKQRRKEWTHKMLMMKQNMEKKRKKMEAQIHRLAAIEKDLKSADARSASRIARRLKKKEYLQYTTHRLGLTKFVKPIMEVSFPQHLKGSLTSVKQGRNLLAERYTSVQKRNMVEPTKPRMVKQKKMKIVKKWSHREENDKSSVWDNSTSMAVTRRGANRLKYTTD